MGRDQGGGEDEVRKGGRSCRTERWSSPDAGRESAQMRADVRSGCQCWAQVQGVWCGKGYKVWGTVLGAGGVRREQRRAVSWS